MPHALASDRAAYYSRYYKEHRDEIRQKAKRWAQKNVEQRRIYCREYRSKNRDKIRKSFSRWVTKNRERYNEKVREYRASNRERLLKGQADYRARNRKKLRELAFGYKLKSLYGLTIPQFQEMWTNQHGKCAICETRFKERKSAHVDHDAKYWKIRGLLCLNCNMGIGSLKHDTARLHNTIIYLSR